jgi:hypothetical protein
MSDGVRSSLVKGYIIRTPLSKSCVFEAYQAFYSNVVEHIYPGNVSNKFLYNVGNHQQD